MFVYFTVLESRTQSEAKDLTFKDKAKDLSLEARAKNMINEAKARAVQNTSVVIIRSYCTKKLSLSECVGLWVSLILKNMLRSHLLVLLHSAEYHFRALTTTSLSRTDQTPHFFT